MGRGGVGIYEGFGGGGRGTKGEFGEGEGKGLREEGCGGGGTGEVRRVGVGCFLWGFACRVVFAEVFGRDCVAQI